MRGSCVVDEKYGWSVSLPVSVANHACRVDGHRRAVISLYFGQMTSDQNETYQTCREDLVAHVGHHN